MIVKISNPLGFAETSLYKNKRKIRKQKQLYVTKQWNFFSS